MKKLLIILLFFITVLAKSQDVAPVDADFKTLYTYSLKYHLSDSTIWIWKVGADKTQYGWTKLHGDLRHWWTLLETNTLGVDTTFTRISNRDSVSLILYRLISDTVRLKGTATVYDLLSKVNVSDTAAMLSDYINKADTSAMLEDYINKADTSVMLSKYATDVNLTYKEDKSNKVTSISGASTDVQYPSAKLTYDQLALKQNLLTNPVTGTGTVNYFPLFTGATTIGNAPLSVGNGGKIYIRAIGAVSSTASTSELIMNVDNNIDYGSYIRNLWTDASGTTAMVFGAKKTGTYYDAMRIEGGNIDIGGATAGYKLGVNGTVLAATSVTTPTILLTTDATLNWFWKCTNATTGAGAWSAITASQFYNGAWDANTNTPTLADGTGTQGTYYHCTVSGTVDFDGAGGRDPIAFTQYIDDVAYNGATWEKIPNAQYQLLTMSSSVIGGAKLGGSLQINSDVLNINNFNAGALTISGTGSDVGKIWTLNDKVVTLEKMADMATASFIGRNTAATGVPEILSVGVVQAMLGLGTAAYATIGDYLPLAGGTMTGSLIVHTNTTGLFLNRDAVTDYNGVGYSTANVNKWFTGMRNNLSSNNYVIFNYSGDDAFTLSNSTNAATFISTVSATQLISNIATGTAPLSVTSTTVVPNLNVSFLEGHAASYFQVAGNFVAIADTSGMLAKYARKASPTFTGLVTTPLLKVTTGAGLNKVLLSDTDGDLSYSASALGTSAYTASTAYSAALSGTINEIAYFNSATTIASLAVATYPSLTELSYVKGVTSAIQTQLNAKQATLVSGTNLKTVSGVNLLGSGDIGIITSAYGGTGNGFTKFSGATTSEKTYSLPNANTTILTTSAAVTVPQGGTGLTTLTDESVIIGQGTATPTFVAPSTAGNLLRSDGTSWASASLATAGIAAVGQTFYIGTTQVAINRASAALTLAGITLTTPDIGTPSAGVATNLTGTATALNIGGNAATVTVAANTDNATYYPLFSTAATGSLAPKTTAAKLTFNPSTGVLVSTNFQLSDERLKRNINSIDFRGLKTDKVQWVQFIKKDDKENTLHYGVSAQKLEKIFPSLVNTATDSLKTKSVNYTELLVLKFAEMEAEQAEMKREIKVLQNKVTVLERKVKRNEK